MTGNNLIEVAVGLIMALAMFALVQALVADLITPIIAAIVGEPSFADLSFTVNDSEFRYGHFINAMITFVCVAAAVYFFIVVPYQAYERRRGISPRNARPAPSARRTSPSRAKRCPNCTATIAAAA